MTRLLIAALLLLGFCTAAQAEGKHFLWRISKDGQSLYLVGSVHVLRKSDYPLPRAMEDALKDSYGLVEEIDLSHFDADETQLMMMQMGSYPEGHTLKTDLPPAIYARVTELAKQQKVDLADLQQMRPWLVSIVMLDTQLTLDGFDSASGVDIHFSYEAQEAGMPSIGLEQARFQFGLFANLPEKEQEELLLQSLDESKTVKPEINGLIAAWHDGDTHFLEKDLKDQFDGYPDIYQSVVVQRNKNWMPQLERLMAGGKRYFVVVGALHLVGPDGLLAQFQKDGYKVEQL